MEFIAESRHLRSFGVQFRLQEVYFASKTRLSNAAHDFAAAPAACRGPAARRCRAEDAVDQFATIVLIRCGEAGEIDALVSALVFMRSSPEAGEHDFGDEHSFNLQRANDIVCLVYGSDPKKYADVPIPKERARSCPWEFKQANEAWAALLTPHNKP